MTLRWPLPRLFGRSSAGPQEFEAACDCGVALRGVRTARLERLVCPHCGRVTAMLPRNPRPRPSQPSRSGRRALGRWQQSGAPGARHEAPRVERVQPAPAETATAAPRESQAAKAALQAATAARAAAARLGRSFTLPRLLALAVMVLVVATLAWSWRSARRSTLQRQLNAALQSGTDALDAGRYPEALTDLRKAAVAARQLGLRQENERRAAHLEREAEAWSRLSLPSLESWLQEALAREDRERSRRDFRRNFQGRTAVFEGWLTPSEVEGGEEAAPIASFDWTLAADTMTLELALPAESLPHAATEPRLVVFAAQLDDVEPIATEPGEPLRWRLLLKAPSLVLLTRESPLTRAGRPGDAELKSTLARQRQELGLEAAP